VSRDIILPLLAGAFSAGVALGARDARGDVTSWMAFGGGYAAQRNRPAATRDFAPAMTYSIGVGSSSLAPIVVGGLLRGETFVGFGTDLGVAARVTTGGFARGDWGLAIDAGALWRSWGNDAYGDWPLQGVLTGGSPWGFQLAIGAELWTASKLTPAQGFFAALEIDLLRLTVMRQGSSEHWWRNPAPAGGRETAALVTDAVRP
jgi:hypothetical protein